MCVLDGDYFAQLGFIIAGYDEDEFLCISSSSDGLMADAMLLQCSSSALTLRLDVVTRG